MTASPSRRRPRALVVALAILALIAVPTGAAVVLSANADTGPDPLPTRIDPKLPDLTIAPLTGIAASLDGDGSRQLYFGVMIVNVGDGDFRLAARRPAFFSDDWVVSQQVEEAGGGFTEVQTPAGLVYAGDGHDHWHIRQVETHRLETLDGEVLGEVVKQGFCFFDTNRMESDRPETPAGSVYDSAGCGKTFDATVRMGLSVGWGDEYPWHLFQQEIDITEVPPGRYRIRAIADGFGWFDELDESNNETSVEIEITDEDGLPVATEVPSGG
jgi:Lysyl oxidase